MTECNQGESRPEAKEKEASEQTLQVVKFAEKIIRGEYGSSFPDEDSISPPDAFSGPILDLNDETLSPVDKTFLKSWIEEHLGTTLEEAPVKLKLVSPDEETEVVVFDVVLGQENDPWYISRWQNKGEEPSFIFWSEEMYETLTEENGYF